MKSKGKVLVYEIHPFAHFFEPSNDLGKEVTLDDFISYFDKHPHTYKYGLDYIRGERYHAKESCWYMHKKSDIINAVMANGIEIERFKEYNTEMANNESVKNTEKFPLSYMLSLKKK